MIPALVDLSKLGDAVKNHAIKKDVYNAKINNIEDKISNITSLATNASLYAKLNKVKSEIPGNTNLGTTAALLLLLLKIQIKMQRYHRWKIYILLLLIIIISPAIYLT